MGVSPQATIRMTLVRSSERAAAPGLSPSACRAPLFRTTDTGSTLSSRCAQNNLGMTAYQGGVVTIGVGIVIILLCVKSRQTYSCSAEEKLISVQVKKKVVLDDQMDAKVKKGCQCGSEKTKSVRVIFMEKKSVG